MKLLPFALFPLSFLFVSQDEAEPDKPKTQESFQLLSIVEEMEQAKAGWSSFLDRPDLSCGIYRLSAGAQDGQSPHVFDEVYYVIEGKAILDAGDESFPCETGSILYVAKNIEHRFHDIEEDLIVLVFFAKGGPKGKK